MEQNPPRKLLVQLSDAIRTKHYSYRKAAVHLQTGGRSQVRIRNLGQPR